MLRELLKNGDEMPNVPQASRLFLKANMHPKIVSERVGHLTIALTLDVYSHLLPTMQAQAAEHLDEMLYKRRA